MRTDIGRYAIVPEWLLDSGVSSNAIRLFACLASGTMNLLQMTPAELAASPIDTKTYLAVSHWQWVMRQASEPPRLAR